MGYELVGALMDHEILEVEVGDKTDHEILEVCTWLENHESLEVCTWLDQLILEFGALSALMGTNLTLMDHDEVGARWLVGSTSGGSVWFVVELPIFVSICWLAVSANFVHAIRIEHALNIPYQERRYNSIWGMVHDLITLPDQNGWIFQIYEEQEANHFHRNRRSCRICLFFSVGMGVRKF